MERKSVLAMYDVRGIQNYIFRTSKVKDAIGGSAIVEKIIDDALKFAITQLTEKGEKLTHTTEWVNTETGELIPFDIVSADDITVLYTGGGNSYVLYSSRELALRVNRIMSRYVLENTYSMQLAVSITDCTENYQNDYDNLFRNMNLEKERMKVAKPLGALPVMQVELKTGYPIVTSDGKSYETQLKEIAEGIERSGIDGKEFEDYITEKGVDSVLAVVHIDGNNMALRIRNIISGTQDYNKAVTLMRQLSWNIDHAYQSAFESMAHFYNVQSSDITTFEKKKKKDRFVLKILVAGDDITYVCNGNIALDTVEYYCKALAGYTMTGQTDLQSVRKYGFSVCAGVSFVGSHFPFSVAYEVAESCCSSAKKVAKKFIKSFEADGKTWERVGNWVDFQICKNIYAQNLGKMRRAEYLTSEGESLLIRPYMIMPNDSDKELNELLPESMSYRRFDSFMSAVSYYQNNVPRSFAKKIRNTYPDGERRINELVAFLSSRSWKMCDGTKEMYYRTDNEKIAKWYDCLEMMDLCITTKYADQAAKEVQK